MKVLHVLPECLLNWVLLVELGLFLCRKEQLLLEKLLHLDHLSNHLLQSLGGLCSERARRVVDAWLASCHRLVNLPGGLVPVITNVLVDLVVYFDDDWRCVDLLLGGSVVVDTQVLKQNKLPVDDSLENLLLEVVFERHQLRDLSNLLLALKQVRQFLLKLLCFTFPNGLPFYTHILSKTLRGVYLRLTGLCESSALASTGRPSS